MRNLRLLILPLLAAGLAACGGMAAAKTYTRAQAFAIVAGCMKQAGASSVVRGSGDQGTASFGRSGSIQWGYVMSAGKVADVFGTGSLGIGRAAADACLQPYGWSIAKPS